MELLAFVVQKRGGFGGVLCDYEVEGLGFGDMTFVDWTCCFGWF